MENKDYIWESSAGNLNICEMPTKYIMSCIKLMNKMEHYPPQYDVMYQILNIRGIDTDLDLDCWY